MVAMRATDYAAFSSAAYKEYNVKDLKDRKRYVRQALNEWGVGPEWDMMEDSFLTNDMVTTFVRKPTADQPRQIVIAVRGTDIYNPSDLMADVDIASNLNMTKQLNKRVNYASRLASMLTGDAPIGTHPDGDPIHIPPHFVHKEDIVFTGHSLGGAIASAAAQQTDGKAIVYNMGSSPMQWLDSLPKIQRDHDNVLHFTTNRVKDGVVDLISASSYFKDDKPGTGIQTISYKLPASKQRDAGFMAHSIDLFHRDPNSPDYKETVGHDAIYNAAIRDLGQPYTTKASDDSFSGPSERTYNNPDLVSAAEAGRQERIRLQKEAEERARKAAEEAKRQTAAKAHSIGGWIGLALFGLSAVLTGGLSLAVGGLAAAVTVGTTLADDIINGDRKSTGELIMDGVGMVGAVAGVGLAAKAQQAARAGYAGYQALEGVDNALQSGVGLTERLSTQTSAMEEGLLLRAQKGVEEGVEMVETRPRPDYSMLRNDAEVLDETQALEVDLEQGGQGNSVRSRIKNETYRRNSINGEIELVESKGNVQDGYWDQTKIAGRGNEVDNLDGDLWHEIQQPTGPTAAAANGRRIAGGVGMTGAALTTGSSQLGRKRRLEDAQDEAASNRPQPPVPRPGDRHGGSGTTPSHAPGSHMDPDEMRRFVSDDVVNERHAPERHGNNTKDVDDVPTQRLNFMHKSLMFGKGVDISTQIPMVTAARGNYLRHIAQVSAMY